MAATSEQLGQMRERGVPVRGAVVVGPLVGTDAAGQACLYAVAGQEAGDKGGLFVLQIDPRSGATKRFDANVPAAGGRASIWSERQHCLFIGAPGREHRAGAGSGWLLRFDPRRGEVENLGALDATRALAPAGIAEAPDGSVYIGSCPGAGLHRWDPATNRITFCGQTDANEYYAYAACGKDGTVAVVVRTTRPHVVVYDPATGVMKSVGPVADTNAQHGFVELFTGADGLLYINSHEGYFRVCGTTATAVPENPARPAGRTLPGGATARFIGEQPPRVIEIRQPDGAIRTLQLHYEAAGVEVYLVRPGLNGKIYGSSILPLHFFEQDTRTDATIDHGYCCTSSGEIYSMDWLDGKLYLCSYTHAVLSQYDPARPYNFSFLKNVNDVMVETHGQYDPSWPCRFRFGPDDNPRQLGRMDTVAYRPRDMVAGPAGKIWVTSMPDYGMWSGTLSWYDPKTDRFGGAHRDVIPLCSPQAITWVRDRDWLALGYSIYGGSGTTPRATRAGFALWDPHKDAELWRGDLGMDLVGVLDLEYLGDGMVYAIAHPNPPEVLVAELLLMDMANQRIVSRATLSEIAGWPLEVSFQRDQAYLYGATRQSIYRVPLGTTAVEVLWRSRDDGPVAGGALMGKDYYFGTGAKLRSVRVG